MFMAIGKDFKEDEREIIRTRTNVAPDGLRYQLYNINDIAIHLKLKKNAFNSFDISINNNDNPHYNLYNDVLYVSEELLSIMLSKKSFNLFKCYRDGAVEVNINTTPEVHHRYINKRSIKKYVVHDNRKPHHYKVLSLTYTVKEIDANIAPPMISYISFSRWLEDNAYVKVLRREHGRKVYSISPEYRDLIIYGHTGHCDAEYGTSGHKKLLFTHEGINMFISKLSDPKNNMNLKEFETFKKYYDRQFTAVSPKFHKDSNVYRLFKDYYDKIEY